MINYHYEFFNIIFITFTVRTFLEPSAVPGTEEIKKEAVNKLRDFWRDRCGLRPKDGMRERLFSIHSIKYSISQNEFSRIFVI